MFGVLGINKFVCGGTFGTIKALRSNRQRVKSTTTPRVQYALDMKGYEGPCINIYPSIQVHTYTANFYPMKTEDWILKKQTTFAFGQFTAISGRFLATT